MVAHRCKSLYRMAPTVLALFCLVTCATGAEFSVQVKASCGIQRSWVDRKRDGCVDYKVFFEVTNAKTPAHLTIECNHRNPAGEPKWPWTDWMLRIAPTDRTMGAVDRSLVAGAILLAVDSLRREYPPDPIGAVCLDPAYMPTEFSAALYQAVAAQMRQLDSKAKRFDDPNVRKMVRDAYQKMDFVRYIEGCLEEEGFTVKVDTAELCCLQMSVEGMAWKSIASEPAVGLNVGSATCCLEVERANAQH